MVKGEIMDNQSNSQMRLTSPVFNNKENIPEQYTCKGQNISPPLNILGVPENTKSLALIMHDPDAVNGDFVHWLVWDIPANTETIAANSVPIGAMQGVNGMGNNSYFGPCPPAGTGTHRYMFELYALDTTLGLDSNSSREQLESALKDHILDKYTLTGLVKAD
jgi:hypothetical protein